MGVITRRLNRKSLIEDSTTGKVIVQRSLSDNGDRREFEVHDSLAAFHCYFIENLAEISCGMIALNEVVPGEVRQRLKIDLDISRETVITATPRALIDHLMEAVESVSESTYGVRLGREQWSLYQSHGFGKISYHLISLKHCVNCSEVARDFATRLAHRSAILDKYVDVGVYKKVQCFRVLCTSKLQSELRFKVKVPHPWTDLPDKFENCGRMESPPTTEDLRASLIAQTCGLDKLRPVVDIGLSVPRGRDAEHASPTDMGDHCSMIRCVEDALVRSSSDHGDGVFSLTVCDIPPSVRLARRRSSFCPIHRRIHHSDNCIVFVSRSDGCVGDGSVDDRNGPALRLVLRCFRGIVDGSVDLGRIEKEVDGTWKLVGEPINTTSSHRSRGSSSPRSWEKIRSPSKRKNDNTVFAKLPFSKWRRKSLKSFSCESFL